MVEIKRIYHVKCTSSGGLVTWNNYCLDCLTWHKKQYQFTKFVVEDDTKDGLVCKRCKAISETEFNNPHGDYKLNIRKDLD